MREVLVIKKFFQSQGILDEALTGFDNLIMSDNSHVVTYTINVQKINLGNEIKSWFPQSFSLRCKENIVFWSVKSLRFFFFICGSHD